MAQHGTRRQRGGKFSGDDCHNRFFEFFFSYKFRKLFLIAAAHFSKNNKGARFRIFSKKFHRINEVKSDKLISPDTKNSALTKTEFIQDNRDFGSHTPAL